MPMWDYECPKGHMTEHFASRGSLFTARVQCGKDGCTEEAEYRPSFWYSSTVNAQRFSPVVIHRDAHGNIRFPGNSNAPVPEGFQKVELTTIQQVRALEKEVNLRDSVKAGEFHAAREKFLDGQLKENRRAVDEILAGGRWEGVEDGKIVERRGISPRGQKILAQLREASMQKQRMGRKRVSPEFIVEAFTQDASNREDHRDASSDWMRVRK